MSTHILCYIPATAEVKYFIFFLEMEAEGGGHGRLRTV